MPLYHKDIWMPIDLIEQTFYLQEHLGYVEFTNHVEDNLKKNDFHHRANKSDLIYAIHYLRDNRIVPFEVEEENNVVVKYAVKIPLYNKDIILVIRDNCRLITFYTNKKNDEHTTLDYKKYVKKI